MPTSEVPPQIVAPAHGGKKLASWILFLLPLVWLWFCILHSLWPEWDTNPQYSYGTVVPILVVGLLLRRWFHISVIASGSSSPTSLPVVLACGVAAFLILPMRLVAAATPEWRPLQWLFALVTISLTFFAVYLVGGRPWLRKVIFPCLFFLVAVPWPSPIETPVIQGLSRLNAKLVVEVLSLLGIPAVPHGNVIEVSTGVVGINDACSGIRSLQSSLMIALFIGEFYFFKWSRRLVLLPVSFAIAMALNLCRATLLTWIAAKDGVNAIEHYHDEAGFTILLICTACLWGVGWLMHHWGKSAQVVANPPDGTTARAGDTLNFRRGVRFAVALAVWIALVEIGVASWYHLRESNLKPGPTWTVTLPEKSPTYQATPPTEDQKILLRYDDTQQGIWTEPDGSQWQAFYFNWHAGRVAGYLAKRHTPDICMTAVGARMTAGPTLKMMSVKGVTLPMRCYTFETAGGPLYIFQCHWEAGLPADSYTAEESSRLNLIRGVWAGRGNQGQKVLEVIIQGQTSAAAAEKALIDRLPTLIKVEP